MPRISSAGGLVLGVSSVIADVPTGRWTPSGPALVAGPLGRCFRRPSRSLEPAAVDGIAVRLAGAGLERPGLHLGERLVELALQIGRDLACEIVERRHADPFLRGVVEVVTRWRRPGGEPRDHVRDGHLEVLLGAGHQAGRRRLDGKVLVHVDPDPEESRLAGRLEDAVTGLAGDLEDDVGLVQRDERLGERLAACLVVERLYA